MRVRLVAEKLWDGNDPLDPTRNISAAWKVLARVGAACRYLGLNPEGEHEFLLVDPNSGNLLASGHGRSTPEAMCMAALKARQTGRGNLPSRVRAARI